MCGAGATKGINGQPSKVGGFLRNAVMLLPPFRGKGGTSTGGGTGGPRAPGAMPGNSPPASDPWSVNRLGRGSRDLTMASLGEQRTRASLLGQSGS